jgi:magnesium transporter
VLQIYSSDSGALHAVTASLDAQALKQADWINIYNPTPAEEQAVKAAFGVDLVSDETPRFHPPSDFKAHDHIVIATALLLARTDTPNPALVPITFIRTAGPFISVTRGAGNEIGWLIDQYAQEFKERAGADDEFMALLDMIIDHAGDALEYIGKELDHINRSVFEHHATQERRAKLASPRLRTRQLEHLLVCLAFTRELLVKLRRSVLTLQRLVTVLKQRSEDESLKARLVAFEKDLATIAEAESDLANTANFILDGAVGFITIQQSKIVNVLTIAGVLLTPPVMIASVYGMNFKIMPELQWDYGYAWALGLMLVGTTGIYLFMRRRGWL